MLTHLNDNNNPTMVDIGMKQNTIRNAKASGEIFMNEEAFNISLSDKTAKGSITNSAIIAGIMAAKNTSNIIPLCHNIPLNKVDISITPLENTFGFRVVSSVDCVGKTGAEMEALNAVSITLLTMYDMLKSIDKSMVLYNICLDSKSGGKSGDFIRKK